MTSRISGFNKISPEQRLDKLGALVELTEAEKEINEIAHQKLVINGWASDDLIDKVVK